METKSSGLAVASLVLGILAIVFSCCLYYIAFPCGLLSIILGGVSLKKQMGGKGMAVAGLVLGIIAVALGVVAAVMGAGLYAGLKAAMEGSGSV